jgi:hypothetical protein
MICPGSGRLKHVSDLNVLLKTAPCPNCGKVVKISIPDKEMHCNTAKWSKHTVK